MKLRVQRRNLVWVAVLNCLLIAGLAPAGTTAAQPPQPSAPPASTPAPRSLTGAASAPLLDAYSAVPLAFEPNRGQTDSRVTFLSGGTGYTAFLTATGLVLNLVQPQPHPLDRRPASNVSITGTTPMSGTVLRLTLVGANPTPSIVGQQLLPGTANYFIGPDPSAWHTAIPTYARVAYRDVYPGVDLTYYGTQGRLEYDYALAASVDPSVIQLDIAGAQAVRLDAQGALVLDTAEGPLTQPQPIAYQEIGGQRQAVAVRYTLLGPSRVGFTLGAYDPTQPLVIDPVLAYSTYLGRSNNDEAFGIAVDAAGNAYVTGETNSTDFPTTTGAYSGTLAGSYDVFVSKLSPAGSTLLYSTFIGGTSDEYPYGGIAVDAAGNAYVAGQTASTDFPTPHGKQTALSTGLFDAFVAKLNATGTQLLYGSYLGGNFFDGALGVATDAAGNVYVAGQTLSTTFPTTTNAYSRTIGGTSCSSGGCADAFVSRIDTTKSGAASLIYSTYLGASGNENGTGVATDGMRDVYVTGYTQSSDFPLKNAYQASLDGTQDAYVTAFNTAASGSASLLYSTYLGGGSESGQDVALDGAGNILVTGSTDSSDFPTANAAQGAYGGGTSDAFVSKLSADGSSLLYSTYLGGGGDEAGYAVAVDRAGNAAVTGYSNSGSSTPYPTRNPLQATEAGGYDAIVTTLGASGSLLFSTYLGGNGDDIGRGIATDPQGNAYVAGYTASATFPTVNALQGSNAGGNADAFVAKLGAVGSVGSSGDIPWHAHWTKSLGAGLDVSVDLSDGHADVHAQDMQIPGQGLDLHMSHTWDSTTAAAGLVGHFGQGWRTDLSPHIGGVLTGTVVYTDSSGAVWPFQYSGDPGAAGPYSSYTTAPGLPWQLSASTAGYTLTNVLNSEVLSFGSQGFYQTDTDAYANSNTLNYLSTAVVSETNSGGRTLRFTYSGGLLSETKSPRWANSGGVNGQHVTYGYNGASQLTSRTQGAGTTDALTTTYGYSGTELVTITTPAGHAWSIGYDAAGRVSSVTSPASGTVGQAGYSPAATTQFSYTPFGQTQVVAGSGSSTPLTTTYTLDGVGEPLAAADGLGNTQHYSYDVDHDVLTSTDADGHTTTNAYQYVGPGNGLATGAAISSTGLITQTASPLFQPYSPLNTSLVSAVESYSYNATNDLIETDRPEGGRLLYGYDGHHSVITTTELLTGTTQWRGAINGYDQYGQLISVTDGRGVSVNSSGVATLNDPLGLYTHHMSYNSFGDQISASTPPITTTLNGVVSVSTPVTITSGHDLDGNQISLTSANGDTISYGYDHLGRPITDTLPSVTLFDGSVVALPSERATMARTMWCNRSMATATSQRIVTTHKDG